MKKVLLVVAIMALFLIAYLKGEEWVGKYVAYRTNVEIGKYAFGFNAIGFDICDDKKIEVYSENGSLVIVYDYGKLRIEQFKDNGQLYRENMETGRDSKDRVFYFIRQENSYKRFYFLQGSVVMIAADEELVTRLVDEMIDLKE